MTIAAPQILPDVLPAPVFAPGRVRPPEAWPGLFRWLAIARTNALALFPRACYEEPLVEHRLPGQRLVVLSDPESIAEVFGTRSSGYRLINMHLRMLRPALRDGVIVAEGESWRRQRRAALRLIAQSPVESASVVGRIDRHLDAWSADGRPQDVSDSLTALSLELMAATLFRHGDLGDETGILASIRTHRRVIEAADLLDLVGAPPWLQTPKMIRARRIVEGYYPAIDAAVAGSRSFSPPKELTAAQVQDFVVNLMSGFESVAATSIWLLALAAEHADLRDWLTDGSVTAVERRRRLDLAIAETLRLYPPLPLIYRQAIADHPTPAGLIRRGSMVCVSPYVVHRNRGNWEDPDVFAPGRLAAPRHKAAYIPFGYGARHCVGHQVGPALVAEIVTRVLERLEVLPSPQPLSDPRAGISLRPERPPVISFLERRR